MLKNRTNLLDHEVERATERPHSEHSVEHRGFSRDEVRERLEDAKWQETSVDNMANLAKLADRIRANRTAGLTKRLNTDDL